MYTHNNELGPVIESPHAKIFFTIYIMDIFNKLHTLISKMFISPNGTSPN